MVQNRGHQVSTITISTCVPTLASCVPTRAQYHAMSLQFILHAYIRIICIYIYMYVYRS